MSNIRGEPQSLVFPTTSAFALSSGAADICGSIYPVNTLFSLFFAA
jgi:hypothetical protein